jgi:hypothetical protein
VSKQRTASLKEMALRPEKEWQIEATETISFRVNVKDILF